jgi:hypothetical protein
VAVSGFERDSSQSPSQEELEAADAWEADDRVPRRPEMTAFRRRARLHQARWRQARGFPIGTQPILPRAAKPSRHVGSRLPLDFARETGANFVTAAAHDAANVRTSAKEPNQTFDAQRLWADLLWSPALAINLFGELASDLTLADRAVHTWWPDAPWAVSAVRFAHSPGRLDPSFLGNLITFDAAFELDLGDGTQGIVAVETKYHDRIKPQQPKPVRLPRYLEVAEKSGVFASDAIDAVNGTELLVMWLEHLLVLSMLQHPSSRWKWGRLVYVHAAGNTDYAGACAHYQALLVDSSTFSSITLEELMDANALPASAVDALRERYIADA